MSSLDQALQERIQKLVESMGFEFVGAEFISQGKHSLLRLYIDQLQQDSKQGVNVDDCSAVSRQVSALLDVESSLRSQYSLEVSSPGLDRPLFALKHYEQHEGKKVKLRLRSAVDQKRNIKGVLKKVEGETIYVILDGSTSEIAIPFSNIEKGNIIGEVSW